jgi:hypothetical protein
MPKKAKVKAKKPARGIAVKQRQSVKQTVKVIVGDIAKKPVRRRTAKPKVATIIQGTGGGLLGSVAPEPLREPQPYSFVPDNRQPRYDFERIQPQPIENAKINLLDYKANHPSVSASGLVGIAEQKKLMDERAKPMISDITAETEKTEADLKQAKSELQIIADKKRATQEKSRATRLKNKALKLKEAQKAIPLPPPIIGGPPSYRSQYPNASSSSEIIMVQVRPKRFLGAQELEVGLLKNRDKALNEKAKAFRAEQRKKRAVEAFRENRSDNESIGKKMERARAERGLLNSAGSKKLKVLPTSAVGKKLLEASKKK